MKLVNLVFMFQPLIIYLPTWLNHGFNSSQKKHYRILIRLGVFNIDSALLFQLPTCILWQNNVSNEMNFDRNSLTSWLVTRKGSQWFLNISLLETFDGNLNTERKKHSAQKMKFSIQDFFSKCDQIHSFLQIWWHLL